MNRYFPIVLGPEVYWALICVVVRVAARRNLAPDPAITAQLDRYWAVLPLLAVPLTFGFLLFYRSHPWWLLLRIDLAIGVGLAIATTQYCNAMTHHEPSSGPGAGTAWMLMLGLGYMLATAATIVASLWLWWASRRTG
jgi:hypothetical protein